MFHRVLYSSMKFYDLLGGGFKYFFVHPYLGKIPILIYFFQMGWNHQPAKKSGLRYTLQDLNPAGSPTAVSPVSLLISGPKLEAKAPAMYELQGYPTGGHGSWVVVFVDPWDLRLFVEINVIYKYDILIQLFSEHVLFTFGTIPCPAIIDV